MGQKKEKQKKTQIILKRCREQALFHQDGVKKMQKKRKY